MLYSLFYKLMGRVEGCYFQRAPSGVKAAIWRDNHSGMTIYQGISNRDTFLLAAHSGSTEC